MKTYLEVSISSTPSQRELLIPTLNEIGSQGFLEEDDALLCYFDSTDWDLLKRENMTSDLQKLLRTIFSNAELRFKEIQEENWNERWEGTIQPIYVGQRFIIRPSWAPQTSEKGKIVLQIDPKMSFGTGYHESTRLILRLLEKYSIPNCNMLDIGTGTGILTIAAAKLGATNCIGIDIDHWAVENAKENVEANRVADRVSISGEVLSHVSSWPFDLICANITYNTILELLPDIARKLTPNGIILLAGLLLSDEIPLTKQLEKISMTVVDKSVEGEWLSLAVKRVR